MESSDRKQHFCHIFFMVAPQCSSPLVDSDPQMCSMLDSGIQTSFPGTCLSCSVGRWLGEEVHTLFLILHRVGHVWTVYVAQTGRFTIHCGITWVDRT